MEKDYRNVRIIVFIIIILILIIILSKACNKKVTKVRKSITIEAGTSFPSDDSYFEKLNEKIENVKILDNGKRISDTKVGVYDVEIVTSSNVYNTKLNIIDTTSPSLKLKPLEINKGEEYTINDFIDTCSDNNDIDCILKFKDEKMSEYKDIGTYDITIIASDINNNYVELSTNLVINDSNSNNNKKNNGNSSNNNENTKYYYVTFLIDNGNTKMIISVKEGEKVKIPSITTKEGNEFKEWQLNGKKYDFNTPITKDITIKAVYYDPTPIITYKYGVKITTQGKNITYDHSGYNATTNDLKDEATKVTSKNKKIIEELVKYINNERKNKKLNELKINNTLSIAATTRALEMAWSDIFSHNRPNGSLYKTVLDEYKINESLNNYLYGENIASGNMSIKSLFTSWTKDDNSNSNIINEKYNSIGVGEYDFNGTKYWVVLFIE